MRFIPGFIGRLTTGLLICFLQSNVSYPQNSALVWSDEFEYTGLPDASKWTYDEGGTGWGNNELQYYTRNRSQNARVANGILTIEAIREDYNQKQYTSARLVSRNHGDWLYGRIEVRAKLPSGRGTWPAIWMLPTDWAYGNWPASGEIDIMEHVGHDPQNIYGSIHTQDYNHAAGTQKGGSVTRSDFESDFHVYAVEWAPEKIDFFVDDLKFFTFVNEGSWEKWPFDKRFHLLLNIAVGGSWGGAQGVDPSIFPQRMEIDYVRVFQAASLEITGPGYLEPGQTTLFSATRFSGYTYLWSIPDDATLLSGQGTSEISLTWGMTEADIRIRVVSDRDTLSTSHFIRLVNLPIEEVYFFGNLKDEETSNLGISTTDGSSYRFTESGDGLKIVYSTVNPSTWPRFELQLDRPVNLKDHPWCFVNLKTYNLSHSVSVRFDFADIYGRETNATPVFRPLPIVSDGEFHLYSHDYTGNWRSSYPEAAQLVDSTRIIRLITYVNGGIFGVSDKSDSLWIESIRFQTDAWASSHPNIHANQVVTVYPNPLTDRLHVRSPEPITCISVLTMNGIPVYDYAYPACPEAEINLAGLPSGIYLLKIISTANTTTFLKVARK